MRIDYSEPKQSNVVGQSKMRPRKEPVGMVTSIVIITGVITFIVGFGTGWFLSQKSAKKSFQAAMEQKSLENSPAAAAPMQTAKPGQQPVPPESAILQTQPGAPAVQSSAANQTVPEPPLSFYKTLPNGQQNNVIGSGINTSDEKGKQPLQAAIPSNLRQAQLAADADRQKPEKSLVSEKSASRTHDNGGFVVQVASFTLKSEAESLKAKLAAKGYSVAIIESNQGDKGTWYRVRVGKKLEQEAAKELAGKLGRSAMVIPDRD